MSVFHKLYYKIFYLLLLREQRYKILCKLSKLISTFQEMTIIGVSRSKVTPSSTLQTLQSGGKRKPLRASQRRGVGNELFLLTHIYFREGKLVAREDVVHRHLLGFDAVLYASHHDNRHG